LGKGKANSVHFTKGGRKFPREGQRRGRGGNWFADYLLTEAILSIDEGRGNPALGKENWGVPKGGGAYFLGRGRPYTTLSKGKGGKGGGGEGKPSRWRATK